MYRLVFNVIKLDINEISIDDRWFSDDAQREGTPLKRYVYYMHINIYVIMYKDSL